MFKHRVVPPNVNITVPNPAIEWETYKLSLPRESVPLPCSSDQKSLVAICSSGIGGSNAHVVVESFPGSSTNDCLQSEETGKPGLLLLITGGLSPRAAASLSDSVLEIGTREPKQLRNLTIESYRRARQVPWRTFAVFDESSGLPSSLPPPTLSPRTPPPIIFLFSGQGPQYADMGRQLFQHFAVFRNSVLDSDAIYRARVGESLIRDHGLFDHTLSSSMDSWPIRLTLPALAIFQTAMFDLLISIGVKPDMIMGHSAGETSVLYASGAASKRAAIELAIARAEAFTFMEDRGGTMAALACDASRAKELIKLATPSQSHPGVDIACYNSPSAVAIAGPEHLINSVLSLASATSIWARKIKTRVPVHSAMMELCRHKYEELVADVYQADCRDHSPHIPTISTASGCLMNGQLDADYYWRSTREPVRFTEAIASGLAQHSNAVFIEISPHPVLTSYVSEQIPESSRVIPSARRPGRNESATELLCFLTMLGQLTLSGYNAIDLKKVQRPKGNHTQVFPPYPFIKKQFPLYPDDDSYQRQQQARNGPLNHRYLKINQDTHPVLVQHVVRGEAVMPAAGFLEMALEFGATCLMNVNLRSILPLISEAPVKVRVERNGCYWSVSSIKRQRNDKTPSSLEPQLHADGYLAFESIPVVDEKLDIFSIKLRCQSYAPSKEAHKDSKSPAFYPSLAYALNYGPIFQRVVEVNYSRNEALVKIKGLCSELAFDDDYILHPAILDACFHVTAFRQFHGNMDSNAYYLPARIRRLLLHGQTKKRFFPGLIYAYCVVRSCSPDTVMYDITVSDELGNILCSLEEFETARHHLNFFPDVTVHHELIYQPVQPLRIPQWEVLGQDTLQVQVCVCSVINTLPCSPLQRNLAMQWLNDTTHTYWYTSGCEMDFQWYLSGLDPGDELDVWILSEHGRTGDEAMGLVRALRREFLAWNIRLVLFPDSYNEPRRLEKLHAISGFSGGESEFVISSSGEILVPRLVSFSSKVLHAGPGPHISMSSQTPLNGVQIKVLSTFQFQGYYSFVGILKSTTCSQLSIGALVGGFILEQPEGIINVDPAYVQPIDLDVHLTYENLALTIPGLVVSALAPSYSVFKRRDRVSVLRALLLDDGSVISQVVKHVYLSLNTELVHVHVDIGLLQLSCLGTFDVVISGREDLCFAQIARTLLRGDHGRLCLWNTGSTALSHILRTDPCLIGDALQSAIPLIPSILSHLSSLEATNHIHLKSLDSTANRMEVNQTAMFDSDKTYLLLGGIGSLGAHIALWMYQHGARHLILTSRRGLESLRSETNRWALRIVDYLRTLKDLDMRFSKFDAGNVVELRKCVQGASPPVAACFLLTTSNADGAFVNLTDREFTKVRDATSVVLDSLGSVLSLEDLDFLIAFSSVSALFGNEGQSNYCSAKCAVDGSLRNMRNAFSFVCPPILGTSLVTESHGIGLTSWNVSVERMLQWLEDSIRKFQNGHIMSLYVPDLEWQAVSEVMGTTKLMKHLLPQETQPNESSTEDSTMRDKLLALILESVDVPKEELSPEVPLSSYGLDSLSASKLSFLLRKRFSIDLSQIQLLSHRLNIQSLLDRLPERNSDSGEGAQLSARSQYDNLGSILTDMRAMLSTYVARPFIFRPILKFEPDSPSIARSKTILLTGATGGFGCHILRHLLDASHVRKIYVLIRGESKKAQLHRLEQKFAEEGLTSVGLHSEKMQIILFKMDKPRLGVTEEEELQLSSSVEQIIHAAWDTGFMSQIASLEHLISGTRSLIDLSLSSRRSIPPKVLFISTIGTCRRAEEPIPIESLENLKRTQLSDMSGYIQSKWVAEQLINHAVETTPLKAAVIRVGQLTSGRNGVWNTSQWVPAMVKSSLFTNCLPGGDDVVAWMPVDIAAAVVVEMLDSVHGTVHLVHPRAAEWRDIVVEFARQMEVPVVPYPEWFRRLEAGLYTTESQELEQKYGENVAAVRLIDFFRQGLSPSSRGPTESMGLIPKVSLERGKTFSSILSGSDIPQLDNEDVERWIRYWRAVGFLPSV
ncbi:hypothetical protein L218DRAFT_867659 [Marasmius fiardii PR-910]|nr:hypothetical protein L218DRAFT_867659 [Marasmius fiardii PR-910]